MHVKDSKKRLDGRRSILASHLNFGEEARGWDFVSPGHGDVDFEALFRALNRIGYAGPLSIEWEDSGMDREYGAQDALAFVRRTDFPASSLAFDAAMQRDAAESRVAEAQVAWIEQLGEQAVELARTPSRRCADQPPPLASCSPVSPCKRGLMRTTADRDR